MDAPKPVYGRLFQLVRDKDYFVLTTNVDHCFQKAGFDKERLFYTQGDYGLFQCSEPCCQETFENEEIIRQMMDQQNSNLMLVGNFLQHGKVSIVVGISAVIVVATNHLQSIDDNEDRVWIF